MNEKAKNKISWAKTQLFLEHPFFGCLGMRLKFSQSDEIETLCTDGTRLIYNPEFLLSLSNPEILGVLVHEIMHCAMMHMYRGGTRDHLKWNYACDAAINQIILDMKFTLPKGCVDGSKYKNMPAEQIYAKLPVNEGGGGGKGKGPFDPNGPTGTFEKPKAKDPGQDPGGQPGQPGSGIEELTEVDWQMAVEQATVLAKKAGKLPGNMDRTIKDGRPSNQNWREMLWRFVENTLPSDYSWSKPNRRYIHQGIYLPTLLKENMPKICLVCDVSGSISVDDLALVKPEIEAILKSCRPTELEVIYCDTKVQKVESFTPDDNVELSPKGGGGTMFAPAFEYIIEGEEQPCCILFMTDTYAGDLDRLPKPNQEVLWMIPERYRSNMERLPFGEHVYLSCY